MDATDMGLDLDSNFEPQTRARSNTWPLRPSRELETQRSPDSTEDGANNAAEQQNIKDPLGLTAKKSGSRRNAWGNLSYADLITKAIQSSPEKRLTLSQIYDWMVQNVPFFKDKGDSTSSAGWKNSIRHNLSLHSRFMRIQNEGTGKSSWWVINPDAKPGKTPRRRAGSMETKSYEKKRGRVRKKVEALRAMENGGGISSSVSEDYLDAMSFGDFRPRASSNASSCGRLSPIQSVAEPDLHDNQVPPMSPIPWGAEVNNSPTLYSGDGYSDLVDSLVDRMKLSNQESLNMVTDLRDPYISGTSHDYGNRSQSYINMDHPNAGLEGQYSNLPAPPPYPKQQQQQPQPQQQLQQPQVGNLEFRQNYNGLRLPCRSSPVNNSGAFPKAELYETVQEYGDNVGDAGLSPVSMGTPNSLTINTQPQQAPQLSSPDRSQQGSPSSSTFAHLSPQPGMVNSQQQPLSPIGCQLSPPTQQPHPLSQQPITSVSLQQQQQALQQRANEASILREALTRGPLSFRSPTRTTASSPNFTPMSNLSPLGSSMPSNNMNSGMMGMGGLGLNNSNCGTHHQSMAAGQQVRMVSDSFANQQILQANGGNLVNNTGSSSGVVQNTGMPSDIDMDLISGLDYDMDSVIKQELLMEGNLDFNFDSTPSTPANQNVVH